MSERIVNKLNRKEVFGIVKYLEANASALAKTNPTALELVAAVNKQLNGKLRSHLALNSKHITSIIEDAEIKELYDLRGSKLPKLIDDKQLQINEKVLRCLSSILGWMGEMEDNLGEGSSKLSNSESFLAEAEELVYGSKEIS